MARTPRDVTEAELAVLRALWNQGLCSVREIVAFLDANESTRVQPPTVQKLLERLERKGWVVRDRSETVQRFRATGDREELIGRRLQGIAEELCEGSLTPLISHLVRREQLSEADRKALRDLIEDLDDSTRKPPRRQSDPR